MYQSLVPEPEGAICPQRSTPQAIQSSPHDTQPVSHTDVSVANWLVLNIQGISMMSPEGVIRPTLLPLG